MSDEEAAVYALDASALLALMLQEPGHERVRTVLDRCFISSVNVAEVISKLVREGVPAHTATTLAADLYLDIREQLSFSQAVSAGLLKVSQRQLGLSLGDCVCIAVAASVEAVALTADKRWRILDGSLTDTGHPIRVEVIR